VLHGSLQHFFLETIAGGRARYRSGTRNPPSSELDSERRWRRRAQRVRWRSVGVVWAMQGDKLGFWAIGEGEGGGAMSIEWFRGVQWTGREEGGGRGAGCEAEARRQRGRKEGRSCDRDIHFFSGAKKRYVLYFYACALHVGCLD
jgi:hypothetical protein